MCTSVSAIILFSMWFRNFFCWFVRSNAQLLFGTKTYFGQRPVMLSGYLRILGPICVVHLSVGDMGSSSCNYQVIWKLEQERSWEFLWMSVREIYELFKCPKVIHIRWGVIGMFSVQITVSHMPLHDFLPWPLNEVKLYGCEGV